MEATPSRHGWVYMFTAHCPTVTFQLHNFDLFRTCRTSCFCTVAWQLARCQLTRRIARSLADSWASYTFLVPAYPGSPGQRAVKVKRLCACVLWCGVVWCVSWLERRVSSPNLTRSSAIAGGPRDASCRLKSCQLPRWLGLLRRLQSVQNAAALLVTGARRCDHITPVLRQLHWLPVRQYSGARLTKYLTTILRLSYDNANVTIDLRRTSNLQNILQRAQGFS